MFGCLCRFHHRHKWVHVAGNRLVHSRLLRLQRQGQHILGGHIADCIRRLELRRRRLLRYGRYGVGEGGFFRSLLHCFFCNLLRYFFGHLLGSLFHRLFHGLFNRLLDRLLDGLFHRLFYRLLHHRRCRSRLRRFHRLLLRCFGLQQLCLGGGGCFFADGSGPARMPSLEPAAGILGDVHRIPREQYTGIFQMGVGIDQRLQRHLPCLGNLPQSVALGHGVLVLVLDRRRRGRTGSCGNFHLLPHRYLIRIGNLGVGCLQLLQADAVLLGYFEQSISLLDNMNLQSDNLPYINLRFAAVDCTYPLSNKLPSSYAAARRMTSPIFQNCEKTLHTPYGEEGLSYNGKSMAWEKNGPGPSVLPIQ